jgi:putative Ca2+/H+ antiporter (TMEM165/GDT1 family)
MDWSVLASTFALIFVAELGDKTQLAVVTQTCKYGRPWPVFWGASLALTVVTLIGVIGGQVLGQIISPDILRIVAAVAFVVMGALIAREAAKAGRAQDGNACPLPADGQECTLTASIWDWKAFGSTFGLLFVAELGDKTQLAVLGLSSKHGTPWAVFVGGTLALTVVTALGAVGGQGLCRIIPERVLLWISAVAFVVLGILMGVGIL